MKTYEDGEILTFKGRVWKYRAKSKSWIPDAKGSGWRPEVYPSFRHWRANGIPGSTPLLALRAWVKHCIASETRAISMAMKNVESHRQRIKYLKSRAWK
jgi:hypothetical protein